MIPHGISDDQIRVLEITEWTCSAISLAGCTWIIVTFVSSPRFRSPLNRLIFYASLGNLFCNAATLIAQAGVRAGANSALCQIQGFLIQMYVMPVEMYFQLFLTSYRFFPADAMWNLCMAINVYLNVFKRYSAPDLRKLEWMYILACYGVTFATAFVYCFIWTAERGRVYGPSLLWCSVSSQWDFLRIAIGYGPAWFVPYYNPLYLF